MSYPWTATSPDVSARLRRVRILLGLLYVGLPLAFVAGTVAVSALWAGQLTGRDVDHRVLLVPAAMALAGPVLGWRQRRRPAVWPVTGAWLGAIAGVVLVYCAYDMQVGQPFDAPYHVIVYAGGLLLPVGWLLGDGVRRTLLVPPVAEPAGTPYELVYPLRGVRGVRLSIGRDVIAVQERVPVPDGADDRCLTWKPAGHRRLDGQVNAVGETRLSGTEDLRPELALERRLPASAGPALDVDVMFGHWTLPLDDAGTIAEIIRRRMANLTGSES